MVSFQNDLTVSCDEEDMSLGRTPSLLPPPAESQVPRIFSRCWTQTQLECGELCVFHRRGMLGWFGLLSLLLLFLLLLFVLLLNLVLRSFCHNILVAIVILA